MSGLAGAVRGDGNVVLLHDGGGDRSQTVAALPRDVSVVLIEHDMDLVFSFADRISVLVNGALFTEGTVEEVSTDPKVRAVYLGESVDE